MSLDRDWSAREMSPGWIPLGDWEDYAVSPGHWGARGHAEHFAEQCYDEDPAPRIFIEVRSPSSEVTRWVVSVELAPQFSAREAS